MIIWQRETVCLIIFILLFLMMMMMAMIVVVMMMMMMMTAMSDALSQVLLSQIPPSPLPTFATLRYPTFFHRHRDHDGVYNFVNTIIITFASIVKKTSYILLDLSKLRVHNSKPQPEDILPRYIVEIRDILQLCGQQWTQHTKYRAICYTVKPFQRWFLLISTHVMVNLHPCDGKRVRLARQHLFGSSTQWKQARLVPRSRVQISLLSHKGAIGEPLTFYGIVWEFSPNYPQSESININQHQSMIMSLSIKKKIFVYWHKWSKSDKVAAYLYIVEHHESWRKELLSQ